MRLKLRKRALLAFAISLTAIVAAFGLLGGSVSNAGPGHPYLALGDSVVFGYITQAGFAYGNPENFIGYPDYVAPELGMTPVNASCPGEATGGFISLASPIDNGCRAFRSFAPLHATYSTSQLDFAKAFLEDHKNTKLVTVQLGANDAFLLQKQCLGNAACIQAGFPALLGTISANMDTILKALGGKHFQGVLMIVNYYSQDYGDAAGTGLVAALNQAVAAHANEDGAVVAMRSPPSGTRHRRPPQRGTPARQGFNVAPQAPAAFDPTKCDVHPSQSGQKLLAQTVEDAYDAAHHN